MWCLLFPLDTSRPKRPNEIDELDYYFVTRDEMERDIQHDRFLEHGELRGHLYGMSFSSIKKVMEAGKIPLLELHPQVHSLYHTCMHALSHVTLYLR